MGSSGVLINALHKLSQRGNLSFIIIEPGCNLSAVDVDKSVVEFVGSPQSFRRLAVILFTKSKRWANIVVEYEGDTKAKLEQAVIELCSQIDHGLFTEKGGPWSG